MSFAMKTEPDVLIPEDNIGGIFSPLDPKSVAKVYIVAHGMFGILMNLAPRFMIRAQCNATVAAKDFGSRVLYQTGQVGAGYFSIFLLFYCLVFENTSLFKGLQVAYAFWVYHQTRVTISESFQDPSVHWHSVVIFAGMTVAMAALEDNVASAVLKVVSAVWMAQGVLFVVAPQLGYQMWKCDRINPEENAWTPLLEVMVRYFGFWLFSCGAIDLWLASGGSIHQGLAISSLCCDAHMVSGFVTGEFQKVGIATGPAVAWILYQTFNAYVFLQLA